MRLVRLRSIRVRLTLAAAGVTAAALTLLALAITAQVHAVVKASATQLAVGDLQSFLVDLRVDPEERPDPPGAGVLVLIVGPDGVVRNSMPPGLAAEARTLRRSDDVAVAAGRFQIVTRTVTNDRGTWRLWAARDLTAADAVLRGVTMTAVLAVPLAVLVAAAVAWFVATGTLRPVHRMRDAAERLRAPGRTGTLPVRGGVELADLGSTLNALISDLRASVALERRVTADAAHELRTPLAVLSAQVELAERHPDTADLAAIRMTAQRLTRLADDLLALSRADEASSEAVGSAAVSELITAAMHSIDSFRTLAPVGVLVDLDLAPALDEHGVVALDTTGFERILANLVGNALGADPRSVVLVRIATEAARFRLEVVDDGSGVDEEFLPRAFERFARPERARGSGASGSGLGLALVQRLVERAGGDVALRNRGGRGAVATVELPMQPAPGRHLLSSGS